MQATKLALLTLTLLVLFFINCNSDANLVPRAVISGPDAITLNATGTYNATNSTDDGTITAWQWRVAGGSAIVSTTNSSTVTITGTSLTNFTLFLKVRDNQGEWSGWSSFQSSVLPLKQPLTIDSVVSTIPLYLPAGSFTSTVTLALTQALSWEKLNPQTNSHIKMHLYVTNGGNWIANEPSKLQIEVSPAAGPFITIGQINIPNSSSSSVSTNIYTHTFSYSNLQQHLRLNKDSITKIRATLTDSTNSNPEIINNGFFIRLIFNSP